MENDFCLLVGLDSEGNIYLESISEFKKEKLGDIAETLYCITSGILNNDIINHLYKYGEENPDKKHNILLLIKKLGKLNSPREAPPLIDALQVIDD